MDKFKNSQIFKLLLIVILLCFIPLLSESLRPTYLYFIVNLLIVALGAESGLISFMFTAAEEKKVPPISAQKHSSEEAPKQENQESAISFTIVVPEPEPVEKKIVNVEKEKIVAEPSLFFIEGGENETEEFDEEEEDDDQEEIGELTGQELFQKAETFIGDFYKQLKMQKDESWNKIHGLYQKAF